MASSENSAYIAHSPTMLGDTYPISAALYHDTLDSARHLYDESAQVAVNWPARGATQYTIANAAVVATWYPIVSFACPMKLRGDGTSFRLRVEAVGSVAAAGTAVFRAVLSAWDDAPRFARVTTAGVNVWQASCSSTSAGVLSPDTDIIYMDSTTARAAIVDVRSFDAVSGGTPVGVGVCDSVLTFWAKTDALTAVPRLFGAYAAGYIGT